MLTSFRGPGVARALVIAGAFHASQLSAQVVVPAEEVEKERDGSLDVSANIAVASEYRFRGIDLSGGDPALQGGATLPMLRGFTPAAGPRR